MTGKPEVIVLPAMSRFDQVRRASGFDGLNLLKFPFSQHFVTARVTSAA
jgi:hypothetical protein